MRKHSPKREFALASSLVMEREFQDTVIKMAQTYGWECFYIPDSKRSAQVGRPRGWPDLTLAHPEMSILIFVECKIDTRSSKLSPNQIKWLTLLEDCGENVQVWRPSIWPHIEQVLQGPRSRTWEALDNPERVGAFAI
jgi:hypothetical protein